MFEWESTRAVTEVDGECVQERICPTRLRSGFAVSSL